MATITQCYKPIKGIVARVIQLDSCGIPVTGSSMIVQSGFIQATSDPQYDTGDRKIVRTADDSLCVNEKSADLLTNFEVAVEFCVIDPGLISRTISPARLLTSSSSPTGTGFAMAEGAATSHWSLEIWQRVSGNTNCATPLYVYNAWPHMANGKLGGSYVISGDPSSLTVTGDSLAANTLWTAGSPWLGSGAITVVPDHWFQNVTTVTPPTSFCGLQDYVAP